MSNYSFTIAPSKLRSAVASLTEHDVPISAAVAAAVAELDRIASLKPAEVGPADLTAMYGSPTSPAALILTAAEVNTLGSRREAWSSALGGAGADGLRAIAAEVPDISEQLRPVAEGHLDVIRWYADQGSPSVADLVRAHHTADAQKAAQAPVAFAAWEALVTMRKDLSGKTFDWTRAGRWSNPEHVATEMAYKKQLTGLDYFATAIRAGGQLWWPSMDQAAEATARVVDAEDKAQVAEWEANRLIHHSAL